MFVYLFVYSDQFKGKNCCVATDIIGDMTTLT